MNDPMCEVSGHVADEDAEYVQMLGCRFAFRSLVCFDNFNPRRRTLFPPTGYMARIATASPACPDAFLNVRMFEGISMFEVQTKWGRVMPSDVKKTVRELTLQHIYDVSPNPPMPDMDGRAGWVEALGGGGFVGLYMTIRDALPVWSIVVRASLHPDTLTEFGKKLYASHGDGETFGVVVLEWFAKMEEIADYNRRRIAHTFAGFFGGKFIKSCEVCEPYDLLDVPPAAAHATAAPPECVTHWNVLRSETPAELVFYNMCVPPAATVCIPQDVRLPFEVRRMRKTDAPVLVLDPTYDETAPIDTDIHFWRGEENVNAMAVYPVQPPGADSTFTIPDLVYHSHFAPDGRTTAHVDEVKRFVCSLGF